MSQYVQKPDAMTSTSAIATAQWAEPAIIADKYPYSEDTFWLGRNPHNHHEALGYNDDRHVFMCAGTRTSKGRSFIINNLVKWKGSVVSVDPKGENASICAERRAKGGEHCDGLGQKTYVLDPFGCARVPDDLRAYYNILDALDPHDEDLMIACANIAEALSIIPKDAGESAEWARDGIDYMAKIIAHVVTFPDYEGRSNLITVRKLIISGNVEMAEKYHAEWLELEKTDPQAAANRPAKIDPMDALYFDMIANSACDGAISEAGRNFKDMRDNAPKQFTGVKSNAVKQTEFLDAGSIRRIIAPSDKIRRTFNVADVKDSVEGISIFLCLPEDKYDPCCRWQRAMIAIIMREMQKRQGLPATGRQLLFCLDEFLSLGKMEKIGAGMNSAAGAGVKLFIIVTNLGDMKEIYKEAWEKFIAGCGLQIWFGIDGRTTQEYLEKLFGDTEIVKYQRTRNESEANTHTEGTSDSEAKGTTTSETVTDTQNWGKTFNWNVGSNWSEGEQVTVGENWSHASTWNKGRNWNQGTNWNKGNNWNKGDNWNHGSNWNEGSNWNRGSNSSFARNWGHTDGVNTGYNYNPGLFFNDLRGINEGTSSSNTYGGSESHGHSQGVGGSSSRGGSSSHGGSQSFGGSESEGGSQSQGGSSSVGGSDTRGGNRSTGQTKTQGGSQSRGGSETEGGSQSTAQGRGTSHTFTKGNNTSDARAIAQSLGLTETFHKKPLLTGNEADTYLARVDDPEHMAYPGLAVIKISGQHPFLSRRTYYDQDPEFERCFTPNPQFDYLPQSERPLLGFEYTSEYFLELSAPMRLLENGYKVTVFKQVNERFSSGETLFIVRKDTGAAVTITAQKSGKVVSIADKNSMDKHGAALVIRNDRLLNDEQHEYYSVGAFAAEIAKIEKAETEEAERLAAEAAELRRKDAEKAAELRRKKAEEEKRQTEANKQAEEARASWIAFAKERNRLVDAENDTGWRWLLPAFVIIFISTFIGKAIADFFTQFLGVTSASEDFGGTGFLIGLIISFIGWKMSKSEFNSELDMHARHYKSLNNKYGSPPDDIVLKKFK